MIPNYSLFLELLGFTFPSPKIPYEEHNITKLDMFCWKDEETPTELDLRETAVLNHSYLLWLHLCCYFVVWPYGLLRLYQFFSHIDGLRTMIHFTMKIESEIQFLFGSALTTLVYRKPVCTGCYLNYESRNTMHVQI